MQSTTKARKQPEHLQAIRAYLPQNSKERKSILTKLQKAAKLQKRSVSAYVLMAALAQADRDLQGQR